MQDLNLGIRSAESKEAVSAGIREKIRIIGLLDCYTAANKPKGKG